MITIYTHSNNPLTKEFWKHIFKKIVRRYSGPDAVLDSLKRGLTELNIPFEINPLKQKYNIVHVLSGIEILKEMISNKQKDKIKTLIAGPTLVQTPYDYNNIIQDKNIDLILFPSNWTKDWFVSLVPNLEDKIKIWPAGVLIPKQTSSHKKILVLRKNIPEEIYKKVIKILDDKKMQYDIITYGKYDKRFYNQKLLSASVLIYLQKTESQGLAIQEAWAHNVPTLVWYNNKWEHGGYVWFDDKIAAPYQTDDSGRFFTIDTLSEELDEVLLNSLHLNPRNYCIENLSDKISTQKYLKIIKIQSCYRK